LSPRVQAAALSDGEAQLLVSAAFGSHPVVTLVPAAPGSSVQVLAPNNQKTVTGLVQPAEPASLDLLRAGNKFLTQFHDNSSALLNSLQKKLGDDPSITPEDEQPDRHGFGPGVAGQKVLVIWLDPVSRRRGRLGRQPHRLQPADQHRHQQPGAHLRRGSRQRAGVRPGRRDRVVHAEPVRRAGERRGGRGFCSTAARRNRCR